MDYLEEGCKKYNEQDYKLAIKNFIEALGQASDKDKIYYNIGMSYLQLEDYKKSEKWFRLIKNKENKEYYAIGYCRVYQEDFGGALCNFILASYYDKEDEATNNAIAECVKLIAKNKE